MLFSHNKIRAEEAVSHNWPLELLTQRKEKAICLTHASLMKSSWSPPYLLKPNIPIPIYPLSQLKDFLWSTYPSALPLVIYLITYLYQLILLLPFLFEDSALVDSLFQLKGGL